MMVDYSTYPLSIPDPGMQMIDFDIDQNTSDTPATHNKERQTQVFKGHLLKITLDVVDPLDRFQVKKWYTFQMRLKGPEKTFEFSPSFLGTSDGNPSGSPSVDSITSDNETITTSGWDADLTNALRVGDIIECNGEFKFVAKDIDTDGSGNASIPVWPPFRSDPSGSDVIFDSPTGTFSLLNEDSVTWRTQGVNGRGVRIQAREDF